MEFINNKNEWFNFAQHDKPHPVQRNVPSVSSGVQGDPVWQETFTFSQQRIPVHQSVQLSRDDSWRWPST